jgi:hypothetical protein
MLLEKVIGRRLNAHVLEKMNERMLVFSQGLQTMSLLWPKGK